MLLHSTVVRSGLIPWEEEEEEEEEGGAAGGGGGAKGLAVKA